jgi:hypothetical protein
LSRARRVRVRDGERLDPPLLAAPDAVESGRERRLVGLQESAHVVVVEVDRRHAQRSERMMLADDVDHGVVSASRCCQPREVFEVALKGLLAELMRIHSADDGAEASLDEDPHRCPRDPGEIGRNDLAQCGVTDGVEVDDGVSHRRCVSGRGPSSAPAHSRLRRSAERRVPPRAHRPARAAVGSPRRGHADPS